MQSRNVLRKATELGIGIVAIATMILAGCGGGGSSGSATCSATGTVSGAEAVNCLFAETSADWDADLAGMSNWADTSSAVARANMASFVATGTNTYTYNFSYMDLATSSSVWSTGTLSNSSIYYLAATGWQPYEFRAMIISNNGNGTMTARMDSWYQSEATAITRTDLSGQPVACTNPLGSYVVGENIGSASSPEIVVAASCPVAVTYPAGSASYTTTSNSTENEIYFLWEPTSSTLTDGGGVTLSALPSIGMRFCKDGYVYDPISGAAAGTDNYNIHYIYPYPGTCTETEIINALGNLKLWTALISLKATGNAAVPNVFNIKTTIGAGSHENMYAFHLGKMSSVLYSPASTSTSTSTGINKTAANAQLRANGLPPLP